MEKALAYLTQNTVEDIGVNAKRVGLVKTAFIVSVCMQKNLEDTLQHFRKGHSSSSLEPDVVYSVSVIPLQYRIYSVCMFFVRLGHYNE